jgi:hypothetical protein
MTSIRLRDFGFILCLIGVLVMAAGRFVAPAPAWMIAVGLGVIVLGWGLLIWSILLRAATSRLRSLRTNG